MVATALLNHFDELVGIKKPKNTDSEPKKVNMNTPENLDKFIDKYFKRAVGVVKIDREGVTVKIRDGRTVFIKRNDLIEKLQGYDTVKGIRLVNSPMVIWEGFGLRMRTAPHDFLNEIDDMDFWACVHFTFEENIYAETMPYTVVKEK